MLMFSMEQDDFFEHAGDSPLFIKLVFVTVITLIAGTLLFVIVKGLRTWLGNNASPVMVQQCRVVDKRTEVVGGSGNSRTHTHYFITFEFEDRSRKEWRVSAGPYGLIAAGDRGVLASQGTRFKGFERSNEQSESLGDEHGAE